ncbi:hypothetical protein N7461_009612 [Penicillium sp. DV-2018c]|nr:hypothetical protein N7461_009612 [Penicillium sp. DV-2018c]
MKVIVPWNANNVHSRGTYSQIQPPTRQPEYAVPYQLQFGQALNGHRVKHAPQPDFRAVLVSLVDRGAANIRVFDAVVRSRLGDPEKVLCPSEAGHEDHYAPTALLCIAGGTGWQNLSSRWGTC